ncbi:MAG: 16S rRNA (adenine(1518)-N(6)/adenine(1519)-N(6))-dimethyltransferase RsmA, partial [bacterium]
MKSRHTKRDLVRIFKERGLRANRLLGQHFLVDHNLLELICRTAEPGEGDLVLEIGAGTGLLTGHLAESGARVLAVEIDRDLFEIASEYVGAAENVRILRADIHGKGKRLNRDVRAAVQRALPGRTLKVVGNLPYCISSDLILSLAELALPVERMVLVVQKEFANRLLARPGTRDYGPLTVLLRAQAKVKRVRDLAPGVFWPVPDVTSTLMVIRPDPARRARIRRYRRFKTLVKTLFTQRRKT